MSNIVRVPITRVSQLSELDEEELLEGYNAGFNNEPEPGNNRSYSYWHGWRNGITDAGNKEPDKYQQALCEDAIKTGYFKDMFK